MSISSISNANAVSANTIQNYQSKRDLLRSEFQQLGKDLQAGNLSQAQTDFATLSANLQGTTQVNAGASQAFTALGQALQAGDLSSAQQDYAAILQNALQNQAQVHHHHHHHHGHGSQSPTAADGQLSQAFATLGQDLQTGNLSDAQQAYSTILQRLQQLGFVASASSISTSTQPTGSTVNLSA